MVLGGLKTALSAFTNHYSITPCGWRRLTAIKRSLVSISCGIFYLYLTLGSISPYVKSVMRFIRTTRLAKVIITACKVV